MSLIQIVFMTDHQKISQTLEILIISKIFSKPGINKVLLNYRVTCTLNGEHPKEFQIANDFLVALFSVDHIVDPIAEIWQ